MPNTTSAAWPTLTAGTPARASDVEAKFDWSEYHLWPHANGNFTDNTYDVGNTATAAWRAGYFYSLNATSTARGLAIGTTTVSNNSDVALEIAGIRSLLFPRLTTTQRDALAGINGMVIYNSTANQFQMYQNGGWTAMGGGAAIGYVARVRTSMTSGVTTTALNTGTGVSGRLAWLTYAGTTSGDPIINVTLDSFTTGWFDLTTSSGRFLYPDIDALTTGALADTTGARDFDKFFKDQLKVLMYNNGAAGTFTSLILYERS